MGLNRKLFSKRYPAYVISLDRTPHRLAQFRAWNDRADILIERFPAVDGRALDLAAVGPDIVAPGNRSYGRAEIGAALSHRALWLACAAGTVPLLICEDDAGLRADIRTELPDVVDSLPGDWDILLLGFNSNTVVNAELSPGTIFQLGFQKPYPSVEDVDAFAASTGRVGFGRMRSFFGLCAYLVTPKGARKLLDLCFPLDGRPIFYGQLGRAMVAWTLDARMNDHLGELNAYICAPPLAMATNDAATSAKT